MKYKKIPVLVFLASFFTFLFLASTSSELDPKYIEKFGYSSICVSGKDYPKIDSYDESYFDYRNGKFYIEKKGLLNMRAILPEGKKYRDLYEDFIKRSPGYVEEKASPKMVWRVFASHDVKGNKIYSSWPPSASDMAKEVSYATSEKELAFYTSSLLMEPNPAIEWTTSGIQYNTSPLRTLTQGWMEVAKSGWQLYIVNTVAYEQDNKFIVEEPVVTGTVEIK